MTENTRFKVVLGCLAMYFIEGIIKMIFPSFPLVDLLAAEGVVVSFFVGAKTADNIKYSKYVGGLITAGEVTEPEPPK